MALEINDQFDFFKAVQLDDDGNLLVSIVNFTGGTSGSTENYYTTAATVSGTVVSFDRNDLANAYSVDLSGITTNISFTAVTYLDCDDATPSAIEIALDGGGASTIDFSYNVNNGTVALATEPEKSYPYKVDRFTSGTAYTFSNEINVVSVDSLTQAVTVNLPEFANNNFYTVKDNTGNAGTYAITVAAGNKTINGEDCYIINLRTKPSITFLWNGIEYITI